MQYALWSALYRNNWIFLEMSVFLQLRQMASFVSWLDDRASTTNLVISRRARVVLLCVRLVLLMISMYANFCDIFVNFAPWMSKLRRTYVSILSGSVWCAPSLASWSTLSFPSCPSCPLVHWNVVGAGRLLKWYATALKRVALVIPIQPMSSQFVRFVVHQCHILSWLQFSGVLVCRPTVGPLVLLIACLFDSSERFQGLLWLC
jgi:hypothetical protein